MRMKRFLSVLLTVVLVCLMLPSAALAAGMKWAIAVYENGTLYFSYREYTSSYSPTEYKVPDYGNEMPWYDIREDITKVVFDESFADYRPTTTAYWFNKLDNLQSIENIEYLNTSEVTDMSFMFCSCKSLKTLDLSNFDTSKVTDMSDMFSQSSWSNDLKSSCLTSIKFGDKWDMSNVKDIFCMFWGCCLLRTIDVSDWNTSKITNFNSVFARCTSLESLDVSHWDTSNAHNLAAAFSGCENLKKIDVSHWDTSNATNLAGIFEDCRKLETLDLTSFEVENIPYLNCMFCNCENLKTIYVNSSWEIYDGVPSMDMFKGCYNLVGGAGTKCTDALYANTDSQVIDGQFAIIDDGKYLRGYLTLGCHASFEGGDGATGTEPDTILCAVGSEIELPSASSISKSGFKFIGWSDGTKIYDEGATFEVGNEDVNFTAVWECPHNHTEVKNAKAATLTAEGYTGDTYCTDCGAKLADGKAIPTLAPEPTPGGNGGSGNGGNGSGTTIPTPTTPPTEKPTGNATKSAGEFVERCYNVCLGRSSDEAGFQYWLDMLNSGDSCGAEVGYGFVFSAEYMMKNTSNEQFVNDMYSMFFGREADEGGYNSWVEQLNNGASRLQVYAGFASSPEFSNLCSEYGIIGVSILNDDAINAAGDVGKFVGRLYKICLSRYPDYCGFTAWTKGLQEGSKTGSTCAYGFIFSGEFMSRGLSNEEFVVYMYKVFFDREADEAGYNLWLSVLNNGGSYEEVFNGFTGSPEFAVLCASYGINA